jgi:hypothetical protein
VIVELKEEPPAPAPVVLSSVEPYAGLEPAERVILAHRLMQASPPALLGRVTLTLDPWAREARRTKSFLVRELAPSDGKLDLASLEGQPAAFGGVVGLSAELTAWAHCRSAGLTGMATPAELGRFAGNAKRADGIVRAAERFAAETVKDCAELGRFVTDRHLARLLGDGEAAGPLADVLGFRAHRSG